ncbi:DUF4269 domain-containing protein [Paenibacillus sp. S150]|uniref:DUF4269 domain-containing protein n=1 Tax=Paenibacillus sp. S150 TaxID=2749826 RepID=UPI001C564C8F|nr:DUF4269 domain-containing protein [Paenibacillus sp. S150]MBW4085286.1 DUF4269 domain-containing protein [Paenibacillus sp. S150]
MSERNEGLGFEAGAQGNEVHREARLILRELRLMELLTEYHPRLAGTVPLGIQVEGSDLDIICEVYNPGRFTAEARRHFGRLEGFRAVTRTAGGRVRTKINFRAGGWPIELFGQPLATEKQNAWLHMLVEEQILNLLGPGFREAVISMKAEGMKTEPAFARLLRLEGDPYEAMLSLGRLTKEQLDAVCTRAYPYI